MVASWQPKKDKQLIIKQLAATDPEVRPMCGDGSIRQLLSTLLKRCYTLISILHREAGSAQLGMRMTFMV